MRFSCILKGVSIQNTFFNNDSETMFTQFSLVIKLHDIELLFRTWYFVYRLIVYITINNKVLLHIQEKIPNIIIQMMMMMSPNCLPKLMLHCLIFIMFCHQ